MVGVRYDDPLYPLILGIAVFLVLLTLLLMEVP
jgi:hypothetical protein